MNRNSLFGIIMAVLLFSLIVLTIETTLSWWQVPLGFFIFLMLVLVFANIRNALVLAVMTLVFFLTSYLVLKYHLFGIIPGEIAGIAIGLLMHFGWIVPHKPFSRSEYVNSQKTKLECRKGE